MNRAERLAIWQQHLANAQASLASVPARFSGLSEAETSNIRSGWKAQVKTAQGFVDYYSQTA
jgi:hypothetical protein